MPYKHTHLHVLFPTPTRTHTRNRASVSLLFMLRIENKRCYLFQNLLIVTLEKQNNAQLIQKSIIAYIALLCNAQRSQQTNANCILRRLFFHT